MNTYEKQGTGWPVIVNQESDQDSCPACPDLVGAGASRRRIFFTCDEPGFFQPPHPDMTNVELVDVYCNRFTAQLLPSSLKTDY